MIYASKPIQIEAFQLTIDRLYSYGWEPAWWQDAMRSGQLHVVKNSKSHHVTIFRAENETENVQPGDWVCYNGHKIFKMLDREFREAFDEIQDNS